MQHARLTVGQLDPDAVVRIAGGEHAYVGDVIVTRRNDRELRTSIGEPVRNRDLWTVTATHADGALTVSHLGGHGTLTLPADYVGRHVRLGYAATEHGHQGDTVDVGIALVSAATTHRGLYVAMTRAATTTASTSSPRPPTPPRPATSSSACSPTTGPTSPPSPNAATSPTRSRPTTRDRPGDTSRRRSSPTGWRPGEPSSSNSATTSTGYLAHRAERRADAAAELAELQPDLAAARAAWQPYAERIAAIEDELRTDLRPAMWKANHDATHAGFGHRHSASRRANDATERVERRRSSHRVHPRRRCRRQTTPRRARGRGAQPPRPRPPVTRRLRPRTVPP